MTKFIVTKGFTLPCYCLASHEDQARGFQNFDKIPAEYGLLFPGMHGRSFHMRNVRDSLLACGLVSLEEGGNTYKIVSSEIWKPEGSCPYQGDHVLECHTKYKTPFEVGTILCLVDSALSEDDLRLL